MGRVLFLDEGGLDMKQIWISFRSLTYAQRAARVLERKGISATLVRLPQGVSKKGCGYALILRGRVKEALNVLEAEHIPWGQSFERLESGEYREVQL